MNKSRKTSIVCLSALLVASMIAGCATTHQQRSVNTSGFLSDYSQLQKGKGDEALMVYIDPDADFSQYNKIILEPVRIVASEDSKMANLKPEDSQKLADYFYAALNKELGKDYQMVSQPGPDTMRIRTALTDATGSRVALDTVSTVLPIGLAISGLKSVATGTGTGVGTASGEIEILDSATGKRLAAAVDSRAGSKITGRFDKFDSWKDAQDACDYWAERLKTRLAELSQRSK